MAGLGTPFGPPRTKLALTLVALALALAGAWAPSAATAKAPPLRDPVFLNIGFVCKWQERCIDRQQRAMRRALSYVRKHRPPSWKVQLCNRNASRNRGRGRVDWVGFDNCIRNKRIARRR